MKFKWPGAKFPGTPSYCFGCAGEDLKVSRLRGRKPGFNCENTLRDITSSTGSRIRLLGGGIDYGIPEGCYANFHQIEDGWQVILSLTAEDGCKTTDRHDPGSLMGKLMENLQGGYELPDGFVIDPLGVLEEEPSRHGVKNDHPQGVRRLTDTDSQDPVRFLSDMKRRKEQETHRIRVTYVLKMRVELRRGSMLKKVLLPTV